MYRPSEAFTIPAELLIPTKEKSRGVLTKKYPEKGELFFCSFRTFGGTEQEVNGVYSVIDTAEVETWFRPDITAECQISVSGARYEIVGSPENISMRNQFLKFKVQRVKGGA